MSHLLAMKRPNQRTDQAESIRFADYILTDQPVIARIEQGLRETYYTRQGLRETYCSDLAENFLQTDLGIQDIEANVFRRYNNSLTHVLPWVARFIELRDKSLVEIGSGTGSSTAAFAHFVKSVHGYDINAYAVEGARKRLEALGLTNAVIDIVSRDRLISKLTADHRQGADIVLLFAVLEHQTAEERRQTLEVCWNLLNRDGFLVVVETPNLLTWFDFHTSLLPFLHLLPTEIYARYAEFSPRNGFNRAFVKEKMPDGIPLETAIARWGRGVSYHDFELAFGKEYRKYIVANGFEKEMLAWVDVCLEEEMLRYYIESTGLDIPRAFTRVSLSLIMQKGGTVQACDDTNVPGYKYLARPGELAHRDRKITELEAMLEETTRHLSNIVHSKRWKLANAVTWPYRLVKTRIGRRCKGVDGQ